MPRRSVARRRLGVVAVALVALAVAAVVVRSELSEPTTAVMPGSFTGYAFDTCQAPSQEAMDAWRRASPYWAVGIYISGDNRACPDQPNLDAKWTVTQSRRGWRLLPIDVGPQAACSTDRKWRKISAYPGGGYATARGQGSAEASAAADAARGLGIPKRSTLWLDLEAFDISRQGCRESTLAFVTAWTVRLHALDYRSGVYSSATSGIRMLDRARAGTRPPDLPDQIWVADWNGRPTSASAHLPAGAWAPHARVHQYRGPHRETHGGVTLSIDSDFVDVGRGTVPGRAHPHCGVRVDFGGYRALGPGARGAQVAALQCLLRQRGFASGAVTGSYGAATEAAVRRFERARAGTVTGSMDRARWTALLAAGPRPLLKYGAGGDAVRRLQRALNATASAALPVTGVFEATTEAAVRRYQRHQGLPRTGVVTADLWSRLQAGR